MLQFLESCVGRSWTASFAVGHPSDLESHCASSCFSELMAKLEKHKGEEEEEEESDHSDHGEDPH